VHVRLWCPARIGPLEKFGYILDITVRKNQNFFHKRGQRTVGPNETNTLVKSWEQLWIWGLYVLSWLGDVHGEINSELSNSRPKDMRTATRKGVSLPPNQQLAAPLKWPVMGEKSPRKGTEPWLVFLSWGGKSNPSKSQF